MPSLSFRQGLAAAAIASTALLAAGCSGNSPATAPPTAPATSAAADPSGSPSGAETSPASTSKYTDGSYQANGSYNTPQGMSNVDVSLTLAGDKITAVTVTPKSPGRSNEFQTKFAGGIAGEIVGKSLDEINVSKVSGSSLTSGGFNQAVEKIKTEASK